MSDVNKAAKEGPHPVDEGATGIPVDDMNFLFDCLKNPVGGGAITIDIAAVAEARGYKNTGSVANRITKLKKRYNLPITSSGAKKTNSTPAGEATIPVTPNKAKVTKARTTRGRAVKVQKKPIKSDDESGEDGNAMINAAPKKVGKFTTVASGESGEDEDGNFIYKAKGNAKGTENVKSSDIEEGEVSEMEEDGDDLEKARVLKVQASDED